jgi:hypothetical protein
MSDASEGKRESAGGTMNWIVRDRGRVTLENKSRTFSSYTHDKKTSRWFTDSTRQIPSFSSAPRSSTNLCGSPSSVRLSTLTTLGARPSFPLIASTTAALLFAWICFAVLRRSALDRAAELLVLTDLGSLRATRPEQENSVSGSSKTLAKRRKIAHLLQHP